MSNNKICVIGSNSFSGASFCKYMLELGYEIIAISRSMEPKSPLLPYTWIENSRLQFHQLDLNHNLEEIIQLIDKHKIGHIYNFAAQSMVGQSWQYPEHWFQTNCVSTIKLHNQLKDKEYLEKYIHISTPEVYGSTSGLVKESKLYKPSTPYAVSRAATDMSLHSFFDAYQFPVMFTRAANVYGEGQQLYRIIPKTILSILNGNTFPLHGGGVSRRSFIHIDDVCRATQLIADTGCLGETYHISTDECISIKQLVETICDMMKADFNEVCQVSEERLGKDAMYQLDSSKLKSELGWNETINLQSGLDRTINWAVQHRDALNSLPKEYNHKP